MDKMCRGCEHPARHHRGNGTCAVVSCRCTALRPIMGQLPAAASMTHVVYNVRRSGSEEVHVRTTGKITRAGERQLMRTNGGATY